MFKQRLPYAVLFLASILVSGCHKSTDNSEKPAAAQPAQSADQASGQPSSAQASPAAPNPSSTPPPAPASGQTAAAANPSPPASTPAPAAATPEPDQQAANAPATPPPAAVLPEVPAGTILSIRMNETISVKHARTGERFSGTVVHPVDVNGSTVIPSGSEAAGAVVYAHKRGHFKGKSILQLRLTSLNVNGHRYNLDTSSLTRTKKGKGKRSTAFIGGGTGLGMLIGGVATGGVGLLVGGLAGAGAGTGIAGLTGNKDVTIPAESVVNFKLAEPLHLQ